MTRVASAYQVLVRGESPYVFMGGEDAPISNYSEWRDTPCSPWMVSTSVLFHGVDHPRIRLAIFASVPDSVIEFQQGSGQVARHLASGKIRVLVPPQLFGPGGLGCDTLLAMVHGTHEECHKCQRWMLSCFLDEHPLSCEFLSGEIEYCDNCECAQVAFSSFICLTCQLILYDRIYPIGHTMFQSPPIYLPLQSNVLFLLHVKGSVTMLMSNTLWACVPLRLFHHY